MKLECFPLTPNPPELVPGRPNRSWMDGVSGRHAYRCLPLTMANTTGWELLCPFGFEASWTGGATQADLAIEGDDPSLGHFVQSHFAHGILTFHTGYLFRTPPGWAVWASGAPNHLKDGIQPLEGLIETEWLPYPFTMNWVFTRPGRVRFEKGEPFCFIAPLEHVHTPRFEPVIRELSQEPDLEARYRSWMDVRSAFNARVAAGDAEAIREAWQKFYFRGRYPDGQTGPETHVNRRRLQCPHRSSARGVNASSGFD
ncbi:hypothetical protein D3C80_611380 [compost metagenome]